MNGQKSQRIQVFVRCRPLNAVEKRSNSSSVVDVIQSKKEVIVRERLGDKEYAKKFTFDKVFGPDSTQIDVYNTIARPCIEEVLLGYNCTIFAYGQTSTGKTHTMLGLRSDENCTWEDDPESGIIPRTLHHLFHELEKSLADYTVRVSFLELYNEELNDLLSTSACGNKLRLYEDISRKGSVVIQGLSEITVTSKDEVYNIMELGTNRRKMASTAMNDQSSRSHTIFTITVNIKECTFDGEDLLKMGKLNLVDLAGSECIGRSGAVDRRAREAGNINQSLLTLGRVITALVERTPHVPYRESKLTRLLQDSLGGRTKTSIIATVSPATCNLEETLSTLDYAYRAKDITNKPEINQKMTKKMLLREYTEEIERLRKDLIATAEKNGVFMTAENYMAVERRLVAQEEELHVKHAHLEAVTEEFEKMKQLFSSTKEELDKKAAQLEENRDHLEKAEITLQDTLKNLRRTTLEREEQQHLVNCQVKTEHLLTDQSLKLIDVADEVTSDVNRLHSKLERSKQLEKSNNETADDFRRMFQRSLLELEDCVASSVAEQCQQISSLKTTIGTQTQLWQSQSDTLMQIVARLAEVHKQQLNKLSMGLEEEEDRLKAWSSQTSSNIFIKKEHVVSQEKIFMKEKVFPLTSVIKVLVHKRNLQIQQLMDVVEQKMHLMEAQVNEHKAEVQDCLQKLTSDLQPLLDSDKLQIDICAAASRSLEGSQKEVNVTLGEMHKEVEQFFEAMVAYRQKLERHIPVTETSLAQIKNSVQHYQSTNASFTSVTVQHTKDFQEKTSKFIDREKENAEALMESVREGVQQDAKLHVELQKELKVFDDEVNTHSNLVIQNAEALNSELVSALGSYEHIRSQHLLSQNDNFHSLNEIVKVEIKNHGEALEKHSLDLSELCKNQKSKVEGVTTALVQLQSSVEKSVQKQDQMMDKFLHEDLKKYVPTGETPQRREYAFSRELAMTSPHEIILKRFRESADVGKLCLSLEEDTEMSGLTVENKENATSMPDLLSLSDHQDTKVQERSRKVAKGMRKTAIPHRSLSRGRKPLRSSNSDT